MAVEIPGIDADSGLTMCGKKMDIFLLSLRVFASDVPADLEEMKGVSERTLKDYSVIVHEVKSMSLYIGAEEMSKTAKHLEEMARNGDLAGVLAKNEAFIKDAKKVVDNVREWLKNNDK